jgi:N-acetylneuraminate synthase/N,N'-diacetyllegionaminate synthase
MQRPSLVIAEAGVNFNNFEEAKQLVQFAAFAGANIIKFQTFWGIGDKLLKYELKKDEWRQLHDLAGKYAMGFMTTPHWGSPLTFYKEEDYEVIDFVDSLVKIHKIASPYLTNEKYCKYIASKGKPIFLSTGSIIHKDGMARMGEIKQALKWLKGSNVTLLHCVSKYPPKNAHYERILKLKKFGKPVGLSDHTTNKMIQCWPVIEKHFKLNNNCIDSNVSLNPEEFREMVRNIRNYQQAFKNL